jgi:hypothetical protein
VCDSFQLDAATGEEKYFLHTDLALECGSGEHTALRISAAGLILVWPVGVPLLMGWLLRSRSPRQHPGSAYSAVRILGRDFRSGFFYWEAVATVFKIILTGWVCLVPDSLVLGRLLLANLLAVLYLSLLVGCRPYAHRTTQLVATGGALALVGTFQIAIVIKVHVAWEAAAQTDASHSLLSQFMDAGTVLFLGSILLVLLIAVVVVSVLVAAQFTYVDRGGVAPIQLRGKDALPSLSLVAGNSFHGFVSHVWTTGQDSAALIKRQLQLLLPGCRIFLDVDDLLSMDMLEAHVRDSACITIFLSRTYFLSANCQKELSEALRANKPLSLVHEADVSKGGAPLYAIMGEVPSEAQREAVFNGRVVIPWSRLRIFQVLLTTYYLIFWSRLRIFQVLLTTYYLILWSRLRISQVLLTTYYFILWSWLRISQVLLTTYYLIIWSRLRIF